MDLAITPLDARRHDRSAFSCGVDALDAYLKAQATQDVRRKANAVFVATENSVPSTILGYFTLCALGLPPGPIPEKARKHLPRYPQVSATLIGRVAVTTTQQGRGLGGMLLARALRMAFENADIVGSSMVVVDALDDRAAAFYRAHGFIALPESNRLVLPMQTISKLL